MKVDKHENSNLQFKQYMIQILYNALSRNHLAKEFVFDFLDSLDEYFQKVDSIMDELWEAIDV